MSKHFWPVLLSALLVRDMCRLGQQGYWLWGLEIVLCISVPLHTSAKHKNSAAEPLPEVQCGGITEGQGRQNCPVLDHFSFDIRRQGFTPGPGWGAYRGWWDSCQQPLRYISSQRIMYKTQCLCLVQTRAQCRGWLGKEFVIHDHP